MKSVQQLCNNYPFTKLLPVICYLSANNAYISCDDSYLLVVDFCGLTSLEVLKSAEFDKMKKHIFHFYSKF